VKYSLLTTDLEPFPHVEVCTGISDFSGELSNESINSQRPLFTGWHKSIAGKIAGPMLLYVRYIRKVPVLQRHCRHAHFNDG
jgi:hypothetical protein